LQYSDEIAAIEGVVSYGLNMVFDHRSGQNKRVIEVECTSEDGREKLKELHNKVNITINNIPFYLKDFMVIIPTVTLEALMPNEADAVNSTVLEQLNNHPKCYARNKADESSFGSFGVKKINEEYFAISDAHVFLSNRDLRQLHNNVNYEIVDREVELVIEDEVISEHIEKKYSFYDNGAEGHDYCACKVDKKVFDAYNNITMAADNLEVSDNSHMTMFGSMSKNNMKFKYDWENTVCVVKYNGFSKKLNLYKIQAIDGNNVQKGDSGSFINYWVDHKNYTGLLIAKSDTYAYMQIIK